ncbi:extracellular solute-binding protein [Paenibacillus yanchengensis]|uniref:Extracellular solute-binding protein n=1 Tax=Paenibacillus yanchengensis TaxID=2035833 RepID=A0ABW4YI35_9BACL
MTRKRMSEFTRRLALYCLAILALTACTSVETYSNQEQLEKISIYSFDRQDYQLHDDRVLQYMEQQIKLDIEINTGVWDDSQIDVLIAAGDYPDVITIVDSDNYGRMNKWIRDGKLVPLTEELTKGLPYLQQVLADKRLSDLKINGNFYGLPIQDELPMNSPGQHVLIIRQDWLKALHLDNPETLAELEQVLIAFKKGDPDGNQLHDSYGIIANGLTSIVKQLMGAWGIPVDARSTGFLQVGDHYEYWAIQPEVKEALAYVKKLYDQKLIHPDTLSASSNVQIRPRFIEGRTGVMIDNPNFEELIKKEEQLQRSIRQAELAILAAPAGPTGKRGYSVGSGYWGYTVITDRAKNPRAAAELLNYLLSEEGEQLTLYGVPDVHYKEVDGKKQLILEERGKDIGFHSATAGAPHELNWGIVSWSRMTEEPYLQLRDQSIPHFSAKVNENLEQLTKHLVYSAAYHITTPEWIAFKTNSEQLYDEYFNKIIRGQLGVDSGFAEFLEKWKSSGGEQAMQEMSDAIGANQ